jgi:aminopeptidase N
VASAAEGTKKAPAEIFRKDYEPLPYTVSTVRMDIDVRERKTTVAAELTLRSNPNYGGSARELVLDGDETSVKLLELRMDGRDLVEGEDYALEPGKLILKSPRDGAVLRTVSEIVPEDNTQLSGLYKSGAMYCTQCEATGFRRITYYPDRPDNMAVFDRVRIEADKGAYPVLLSNGNLVEEGTAGDDRHYAVWSDPFPKPSYLFAAVAGDLGSIADTYTTRSGRAVDLRLFSEPANVGRLHYALESLKRSMKWDEDRFGLEYDLDLYNIVAVESFNMGVRADALCVRGGFNCCCGMTILRLSLTHLNSCHLSVLERPWRTKGSTFSTQPTCWRTKRRRRTATLSAWKESSATR